MFYFAYGSNLNKKQMASRCPDSKPKFTVVLPNYKLLFTGMSREWKGGVASIKPFKGQRVAGAVYEISDADLRKLDKYEGYPTVYTRMNVMVWTDDNDSVEAVTYIKNEQPTETKPSLEYLALIRQGYKDWDIE